MFEWMNEETSLSEQTGWADTVDTEVTNFTKGLCKLKSNYNVWMSIPCILQKTSNNVASVNTFF